MFIQKDDKQWKHNVRDVFKNVKDNAGNQMLFLNNMEVRFNIFLIVKYKRHNQCQKKWNPILFGLTRKFSEL
jgi:hypothetical protein